MTPIPFHLHLYCERGVSDDLFAEPFNVLSSLAFCIAGGLLWYLYRRQVTRQPEVATLIFITFCIGAGSMAFHALSTRPSILYDVVPIMLFVVLYVHAFARILLGWKNVFALLATLLLIGVNLLEKYYVFRSVDGYVSYIPTFMFLLAFALYMLLARHPSALRVTFASLLAFVSLAFRIMDRRWCGEFPVGTHFLWHIFNAIAVYVLVRELMISQSTKKDILK